MVEGRATHWIVTEDGRIQQQADSIFNLKSPYDLVTFIHQQNAFDRLKILREEYLEEKRKVIEAREKEREEIQQSFYKIDPDCVDAGNHISEFELHLEMTLPFTKKGINIPDHVNLCQPFPSQVGPPYCRAELPTVIYSYDHLEGVNGRHQLNTSVEPTLLTAFSSYFKTVDELGGHVSVALEKNSSSWILLNLAAYYWRIKGNALEAVECLRQALYFSPSEHKDRALMSLAAVLHHGNHSHDSLVLLHTAVDSCSELSVYHFLLGNIYASLKIYEMAELCYRFTLVVSPDTESLCERVKAVRCELKLKELLQERQLDFDEKLDSLKTPELDETKEPCSEEAEKKRFLPLETYKKQLNRMFALTQGGAKYQDTCKNTVPTKQGVGLSSAHVAAKGKSSIQVSRPGEAEKSTNSQQKSNFQTENTSSGIQSKTLEKAVPISETVKASPCSEIKEKASVTNEKESGKSFRKERGKTSETLEATTSSSDNTNISVDEVEEKTMRNLAEARLALDRLKSIIKTVSRARTSASGSADAAEEKASESDSDGDGKDSARTISAQSKSSFIKSTPTAVEKESKVKKLGNPGRAGKRGESGFKTLKSGPDISARSTHDSASKVVISEETKISKQKGESTLMSKNGPGSKFDKISSKNTREISDAELVFEEPKGSRPIGPKHTPPLEGKNVPTQVKNCENLGRKKRKGEVFAMECLTQEQSSSSVPGDEVIKQSVIKTEFSEAATKERTRSADTSPLESDAEAILMKQTLADELNSVTAASKANAIDITSEAKVLEKSEMKASAVVDDAESKTSDNESINVKQNGETASKHLDSKVVEESEMKGTVEDVVKSERSDKESENVKQRGQVSSSDSENSDVKVVEKSEMQTSTVEDVVKSEISDKESDNVKQHGRAASSGRKNSDGKIDEKSETETSLNVEIDTKRNPSGENSEDFKELTQGTSTDEKNKAKIRVKSEKKTSTTVDEKSKSSVKGSENLHDRKSTTSSKYSVKARKGQRETSSKTKTEQKKKCKTLNIKEKVKETEFLHRVGAGSSVFETSFMNVHTASSAQELTDEECRHIEGVQALVIRNKQFSAWLSLDTKNIDVRTHIDFLNEVDDLARRPRCTAKIKNNLHTFSSLQGVANAAKLDQVAEAGLTQTLLTIGRTMQDSVDEMGTRIYNALKKNSTSWVLLNIASLYWRVQGDTVEAIKCLRQALSFSPANTRDVAHVGLASILLREGQLDDTAVVIKKALEISPSLALGHFILGNVFGAQSNIPEAIQHYLLALQLEPGFTPAVERLKIIQCVLWKQQKALEKEADDLRKLLTPN